MFGGGEHMLAAVYISERVRSLRQEWRADSMLNQTYIGDQKFKLSESDSVGVVFIDNDLGAESTRGAVVEGDRSVEQLICGLCIVIFIYIRTTYIELFSDCQDTVMTDGQSDLQFSGTESVMDDFRRGLWLAGLRPQLGAPESDYSLDGCEDNGELDEEVYMNQLQGFTMLGNENKMVLKYLKKTMDYSLTYTNYPSVLEGYTNTSWISNTEDNSSTIGWVFLLCGGKLPWASKKTMESKFVALVAASKEAKWLRNMILEIPLLWSKHIAPIFIRCDM
ncbi:hypothetical protein Tco_0403563 [Tanacetum coccineum]